MLFENKTLIVTGAASGIGLLTAKSFVREGGNAVLADVNIEEAEKAAEEIRAKGGSAIAVKCDVRDYADVCAVRDKAVETFGSIDVMVNTAGGGELRMQNISYDIEFADVPIEVYDWGIDVNLKGQFYFGHAVMKQMREQKSGVIINIGSIVGQEGCAGDIAYATSKSGVMNGLTKSLARYGAKYGVRCVCISPGPVLTRPAMAKMKTALGRAANPQEIVDSILFFASDKSAFTTGVNISIDGGRFMP
jgi:3-oxoacyl-[acyl-carrier protein] reductase